MKHLRKLNETIQSQKIVTIYGDDWQGVYVNDELIDEGHSINLFRVMKKLGYDMKNIYIEEEEFWEKFDYHCPKN
jgi:hypothetical protein